MVAIEPEVSVKEDRHDLNMQNLPKEVINALILPDAGL